MDTAEKFPWPPGKRAAISLTFDDARLSQAIRDGGWLVLVAHEVGDMAFQTMPPDVLERLCRHARDETNGLWIETVAIIADYIRKTRKAWGIQL